MNKFMCVALSEAHLAMENGEVPVGAAIFKDKKLVASSHNRCEELCDPTAHAELLAIKEALKILAAKNLMGCELYVTLEPCPMCAGAIHLSKIDKVYFGAYDIKNGALGGQLDLSQAGCFDYKTEIYGSIEEIECEKLLKDFFKNIRNEK